MNEVMKLRCFHWSQKLCFLVLKKVKVPCGSQLVFLKSFDTETPVVLLLLHPVNVVSPPADSSVRSLKWGCKMLETLNCCEFVITYLKL